MSHTHYLVAGCKGEGAGAEPSQQLQAKSRNWINVGTTVTQVTLPKFKTGSFDALVKLSDEMAKTDGHMESVLRRVERSVTEADKELSFLPNQMLVHATVTQGSAPDGQKDPNGYYFEVGKYGEKPLYANLHGVWLYFHKNYWYVDASTAPGSGAVDETWWFRSNSPDVRGSFQALGNSAWASLRLDLKEQTLENDYKGLCVAKDAMRDFVVNAGQSIDQYIAKKNWAANWNPKAIPSDEFAVTVSNYSQGDEEDEEFTGVYKCSGLSLHCPKFQNEHGSVMLKTETGWTLAGSDSVSADGKVSAGFTNDQSGSGLNAFVPPSGKWTGAKGSVDVAVPVPTWKWIDGNEVALDYGVDWDNAEFPNELPMERLLAVMHGNANKYDELFKEITSKYNEAKSRKTSLIVKDSESYMTTDLLDLLTPDSVRTKDSKDIFPSADDDFIYTANLATVVVVVPKAEESKFLAFYEMGDGEQVVPGSATQLLKGKADPDGNLLYRVVVYAPNHKEHGAGDAFKKACREEKFAVREYDYTPTHYRNKLAEKYGASRDFVRAHLDLVDFAAATYASVFKTWVHLKILRAATEILLRYGTMKGISPCFVSPNANKIDQYKKDMIQCLAKRSDISNVEVGDEGGGDDFLPYVSMELAPLSTSK